MLNPEDHNDIKSIEKCRNIKQETLNYGMSENEILKLIDLLSLELEDTRIVKEINKILRSEKKDVQNKLIIGE